MVLLLLWLATRRAASHDSGRQTPAPVPEAGHTEAETARATVQQARATWVAAVVAGVALVTSLVTWIGQLQINEQQIALNARATDRDDKVYASRVAVWYRDGVDATTLVPAGLDTSVQNRAPAPIDDVRLIAPITGRGVDQAFAELEIGMIPPCTVLTVRITSPERTRFIRTAGVVSAVRLKLAFAETDRRWYLDGGRLKLLAAPADAARLPAPGVLPRLLGFRVKRSPVSDCAEG